MSVPAEGLTLGAVSELIQRKILTDTVRISRKGEPVFNPDTGQYEPGPPVILYEGHGGIFPNGDPGIVLHLEGQAYVDDSTSKYKLITPLDAPVASREDTVSVVNAADPAAVGRTWRVLDVGQTSTLAVVRTTFLDQNTQSSASTSGSAS
ncbi:DUF6093 family protein [Streptomyces acidiscabies]|uniref:DUF6093 family protein n=1 Tax=Streptomyces acidiscabies TaxID=42234 RepID=UPI0009512388|nr:DUF6093 family protein [Streptomyces acidiscabies]